MGFLWDLYQQSKISAHADRADALDQRVARLESELMRTQQLLHEVIGRLEQRLGADLDADGRIN